MKEIDLSDWTLQGGGASGKNYFHCADDTLVLKVLNAEYQLKSVEREFEMSRKVESLGLRTPRLYEIVKVGRQYGIIGERIKNKISVSRLCASNPEKAPDYLSDFVQEQKKLNAMPCSEGLFPSWADQMRGLVESGYLILKKDRKMALDVLDEWSQSRTCLHGDCQFSNLVTDGNEYYWIDLGDFACGDPRFDLGATYNSFVAFSWMPQVRAIFHVKTRKELLAYWDAYVKAYVGDDAEAVRRFTLTARMSAVFCMMKDQLKRNEEGVKAPRVVPFLLGCAVSKYIRDYWEMVH